MSQKEGVSRHLSGPSSLQRGEGDRGDHQSSFSGDVESREYDVTRDRQKNSEQVSDLRNKFVGAMRKLDTIFDKVAVLEPAEQQRFEQYKQEYEQLKADRNNVDGLVKSAGKRPNYHFALEGRFAGTSYVEKLRKTAEGADRLSQNVEMAYKDARIRELEEENNGLKDQTSYLQGHIDQLRDGGESFSRRLRRVEIERKELVKILQDRDDMKKWDIFGVRAEWERRIASYSPEYRERETKNMYEVIIPREREDMIKGTKMLDVPFMRGAWKHLIDTYPPEYRAKETEIMNRELIPRERTYYLEKANKLVWETKELELHEMRGWLLKSWINKLEEPYKTEETQSMHNWIISIERQQVYSEIVNMENPIKTIEVEKWIETLPDGHKQAEIDFMKSNKIDPPEHMYS